MCWATTPETSELFRTPLGGKPPPPHKDSAFRAGLSDVSQVRTVRWGKATASSTTSQGPHIQAGNFKAWSSPAPSDVHNSWEHSAFLNFREVKSSPKGDTQPPAPSSFPLWRCLGAFQSALPFGKGSPLPCLQEQTRRIWQWMLIVPGATAASPPRSGSHLWAVCEWARRVLDGFSLPQQPNCVCV